MREFLKKEKYLGISILLTLFIIGIIFGIKDIYPFGKTTFNGVDFNGGYVPVYYKLWDIIHMGSSCLFDWNLGAGLHIFGSMIMNGLLSPISWIIRLFSRTSIDYTISYILILKIVFISICCFIAIDKLMPKLDNKFKVILTLFYTFSGWTLLMHSQILYLEAVGLFPLFVLAYYKLMKNDKWIMYVVILTLVLLLSYYMAWMYLFFIFGITFVSMITLDIKDKKKKCVKVLLLTLLSLGLSCFLFLPAFYQSISSFRIEQGLAVIDTFYLTFKLLAEKLLYILPSGILFALVFKQLKLKNKRINLWFILMLVYTLIGIFVEPINLLWHTGSYSGMPFRYAYIPIFILVIASAYYLANYKDDLKMNKKNIVINTICTVILLVIFLGISYFIKDELNNSSLVIGIDNFAQITGILSLFIIDVVLIFLIFRNSKKNMIILFCITSIISIVSFSLLYINNSFIPVRENTLKLEEFNLRRDGYNYVDMTNELNINFPYILNVPSMENRLHFIKTEEINYYKAFDYYKSTEGQTSIYSSGGNLFSNLLMQNKYYISKVDLNPYFYNLIDEKDGLYYYEANYNLDYVVPYSGGIYNKISDDVFKNTNGLYQELFNREDNILEKISYEIVDNKYVFKLKPGREYYLYITYKIEVNDIPNMGVNYVQTERMANKKNLVSEFFVNREKSVTIPIENIDDIRLYSVDEVKYKDFINSLTSLDVKVNVNKNVKTYDIKSMDDTKILIPVNYDEGLVIKVNGEKVKYELNAYNMVSIDICKGKSKVEISYQPKYLVEGIIISIISLSLLIVVLLINKKYPILDNKIILNGLFGITVTIGVLFILKVYIMSWLSKIF